jgi:hypothetical protein
MDASACAALAARFASGELACTGPKHFPPETWQGPDGAAAKIAAEIGAGARPGLERILKTLKEVRKEHPDFQVDAAADRFLLLHRRVQRDRSLPALFRALFVHFLTREGGLARPKKGPQVDNTIAFVEEILLRLPAPTPPS